MATSSIAPLPQDPIGETFVWRDFFQRLSNAVFGTVTNPSNLVTNELVIGGTNGHTDVAPLGSTGTVHQVLHGNPAGPPAFAAVDLATEVGATILPVANGGNGTATPSLVQGSNITISGTWPAQTIAATGGTGTVTHTSGNLTAQAVVIGNAVGDIKVSTNWTIDTNGRLTATAATSSDTAWFTGGVGGTYALSLSGSSSAGVSNGLKINSGTNSADHVCLFTDQANTMSSFAIFGDGHAKIGPGSVTNGVQVDASSNLFNNVGGVKVTGGTTGIGYGTGSGGTVTQITSGTTSVTLNKSTGKITMVAASSPAAGAPLRFTLTNSAIAATDTISMSLVGAFTEGYSLTADSMAAGSCRINIGNMSTGGAGGETLVIQFNVIKGATA